VNLARRKPVSTGTGTYIKEETMKVDWKIVTSIVVAVVLLGILAAILGQK
jgi:hypothetical protein